MRITVKKDVLLEQLRHNREEHVEQYRLAMAAYKDKVTEALTQRLEAVQEGRDIPPRHELWRALPEPEDHRDDYDTVISMLEWDVSEEFELEEHQFRQYVENSWDWQVSFAANTMSYLS